MLCEMEIGPGGQQQQGGMRCNRGGCNTNLPSPGSRTGWVTYCSHLFCGPCGRESRAQGLCLACQADLSVGGHHEPAKILRVNLAPTHMEKQLMLAGMRPSDILDVAKAGIEFHEHQRELEVKLMRAISSRRGKKMEAVRQFHEEVVNHYKARITQLESEKKNLKASMEVSRNMQKQAELGAGPQSLRRAVQYGGQVADDSPRIGQQAQHIAAFEPGVEEIELKELDEEDFAPPPPTNSRRETPQVRHRVTRKLPLTGGNQERHRITRKLPLTGGNLGSFGGISLSKLQVRVEKVDMQNWRLNQSRSFMGTGRSNQVASDAQGTRGHNMQEDQLHLRKGKKERTAPAISPLRLF